MPDVLPGYRWNTRAGRYVSQATGRFVSRQSVVELLNSSVGSNETRLADLVTAYHDKQLSPSVFVEQMRAELKRQHLQARALGAGGWDRLTQSDYGSIGRKLRDDYQRIERLAVDIANGDATLPQALNRARGYVGNARLNYWEAHRERQRPQEGNVMLARRTLGVAEHCDDCVSYHQRGWQYVGVLPEPGVGSECTTHCRCRMEYKEVNRLIVGEYLNTRR